MWLRGSGFFQSLRRSDDLSHFLRILGELWPDLHFPILTRCRHPSLQFLQSRNRQTIRLGCHDPRPLTRTMRRSRIEFEELRPLTISTPVAAKHSREAASEWSPRRKPWVPVGSELAPKGAKETAGLQREPTGVGSRPSIIYFFSSVAGFAWSVFGFSWIESSSTSKISVALGPISPPAPRSA